MPNEDEPEDGYPDLDVPSYEPSGVYTWDDAAMEAAFTQLSTPWLADTTPDIEEFIMSHRFALGLDTDESITTIEGLAAAMFMIYGETEREGSGYRWFDN